jgi:hypothetical protein
MAMPVIALVGGFLGAGKTTLILTAAKILESSGLRVAVIMNDQDSGLVDTHFAKASAITASEVAGGCFCCRFSDLLAAASEVRAYQPDVIFAEPVGSCIDLSATIVQPLKAYHRGNYRVAPITVVFDPKLAAQLHGGGAGSDIEYLFRNQIAEADILCATKFDLYPQRPAFPFPVDYALSARTGEGVEAWLDDLLSGRRFAGAQLLQVDYSRYAGAESALGWLNLYAKITLRSAASPAVLVGPVLEDLEGRLTEAGIRIAHLKVFDRASSGFIKASICGNGEAAEVDGDLLADPAREHEFALNLRAMAPPEQLSEMVSAVLKEIGGKVEVSHQSAFRPAPPSPEHRFSTVV